MISRTADRIRVPKELLAEDELRELYSQRRLSIHAIAREKRCHHSTVWRYLVAFGIPRRTVAEAKVRHSRRSFSGEATEAAYLFGFRAGDLHVHRANHSPTSQTVVVACTSTQPEQIELVRSLFQEYGGINLSVGEKQTVITCFLDRSFEFLLDDADAVPEWVLADERLFSAYLAGYVDAEGCIQVKRHTRAAEVVIRSADEGILRSCWAALEDLGVTCPPVCLVRRQGERDGTGPKYRRAYWRLGVYRRESLVRLFTLIAPFLRHPKRRRDMLLAWSNAQARLEQTQGV